MPERLLPRRVGRAPRRVRGLQHRVDRDGRVVSPSSGRLRSSFRPGAERPAFGAEGEGLLPRHGRGAQALVEGDRQDALAHGADVLAVLERRVGDHSGSVLLARQRDGLDHARSARELLLQPVRVIFCWAGIETSRVDASLAQNVSSRRRGASLAQNGSCRRRGVSLAKSWSRRRRGVSLAQNGSRRLVGAKSIRDSAGRS